MKIYFSLFLLAAAISIATILAIFGVLGMCIYLAASK